MKTTGFSISIIVLVFMQGCLGGDSVSDIVYSVTSDVLLDTTLIEEILQDSDGDLDAFADRETFLFDNNTDYENFYHQLMGAVVTPPPVDFGLYRVIATVDIKHNTPGYSVEIFEVVYMSGLDYNVTVNYYRPKQYDGPTSFNRPFHIVQVPIQ